MNRLSVMIIGCMMFFSCAGSRPENLGVNNGGLTDCPAKPNCVSSQALDKRHAITAFMYEGKKEIAFRKLKKVLNSFKKTTIVKEKDDYLYIECKSQIMGFVDDVEFLFSKENTIQVRSASRIGYSDFGVNRKRMEKLRILFARELTQVQQ